MDDIGNLMVSHSLVVDSIDGVILVVADYIDYLNDYRIDLKANKPNSLYLMGDSQMLIEFLVMMVNYVDSRHQKIDDFHTMKMAVKELS